MMPQVHRIADASAFKPEGHEGVSPVRLTGTIPGESLEVSCYPATKAEPTPKCRRSPWTPSTSC